MLKKTVLAAVAAFGVIAGLSLPSVPALADTFTDRQQVADQAAQANWNAKTLAMVSRSNRLELAKLYAFAKRHRGMSANATCQVSAGECYAELERYTRCVFNELPQTTPVSAINPNSMIGIHSCSVDFGDGLACHIRLNENGSTADCYDANSRSKSFRF